MVSVRFVLGSLTVDMESYQWNYIDTKLYLERNYGNAGYGRLFREKTATLGADQPVRRILQLEFIKTDAIMDAFRELNLQAMLTGASVRFYLDRTNLDDVLFLDWAPTIELEHVVENRQHVTVVCAGFPPAIIVFDE